MSGCEQGEIFGLTFPENPPRRLHRREGFYDGADRHRDRYGGGPRTQRGWAGASDEGETSLTTLVTSKKGAEYFAARLQRNQIACGEVFKRQADQSRKRWIHYDFWKENNLPILQSLWQVYKGQHGSIENIRYESCRSVWKASGLDDPDNTDQQQTGDRVQRRQGAAGIARASGCCCRKWRRFWGGGWNSRCSTKESDQDIEYHVLPARDPAAPQMRKLLFHYLPGLPAGGEKSAQSELQRVDQGFFKEAAAQRKRRARLHHPARRWPGEEHRADSAVSIERKNRLGNGSARRASR